MAFESKEELYALLAEHIDYNPVTGVFKRKKDGKRFCRRQRTRNKAWRVHGNAGTFAYALGAGGQLFLLRQAACAFRLARQNTPSERVTTHSKKVEKMC